MLRHGWASLFQELLCQQSHHVTRAFSEFASLICHRNDITEIVQGRLQTMSHRALCTENACLTAVIVSPSCGGNSDEILSDACLKPAALLTYLLAFEYLTMTRDNTRDNCFHSATKQASFFPPSLSLSLIVAVTASSCSSSYARLRCLPVRCLHAV